MTALACLTLDLIHKEVNTECTKFTFVLDNEICSFTSLTPRGTNTPENSFQDEKITKMSFPSHFIKLNLGCITRLSAWYWLFLSAFKGCRVPICVTDKWKWPNQPPGRAR